MDELGGLLGEKRLTLGHINSEKQESYHILNLKNCSD